MTAVLAVAFAFATAGAAVGATALTGPSGPLTADQLTQLLPADSDIPGGYTHTASEDTNTIQPTQDTITSGGAACQKLTDATNGLATTYGTVAAAGRTYHQQSGDQAVVVDLLSFTSPAAAQVVLADVKDSLTGCTVMTGTHGGTNEVTDVISPFAGLATNPDSTGFLTLEQASGVSAVSGTDIIQAGSTIIEVSVIAPATQDSNVLKAMGTELGTVAVLVGVNVAVTSG